MLLDMLADGRLHLTGAGKLAPHLTVENREGLLHRATRRSKRRIEELIAEVSPQPDVPARIRKLPDPPAKPDARQLRPDAVGGQGHHPDGAHGERPPGTTPMWLEDVPQPAAASAPAQVQPPAPGVPARISPLAPARFKVQFTASAELREKLEGLEARRFGQTKAPRKTLADTDTSRTSRNIPAAVRRAVYERDGGRCTFVDAQGGRCTERHRLEFHHDGKGPGAGRRPGSRASATTSTWPTSSTAARGWTAGGGGRGEGSGSILRERVPDQP